MDVWLCPYKEGTLIHLYIRPGARSTEVTGLHDGRLKMRISAPPRDGEANQEIIHFLSKILGLKKSDVEILRGETGRSKDIYVNLPPERTFSLLKQLF
ncbi:MAG: DUF167 domain-containing protein [Bacteriovoracaceae bacterium]